MSGSRRLEGWKIDDMAETLRVNEKAVDGWGPQKAEVGGSRFKSKNSLRFQCLKVTVDLRLRLRRGRNLGHARLKDYLRNYGLEDYIHQHSKLDQIIL